MLHIIVTKLLAIKTVTSQNSSTNKYLSQFLNFQQLVEQNIIEHKKVQYYAEALNITSKTLNNITHSVVQKSAKLVIIDLLILKIKGHLINSNLSASEIAFELGFNDTSHLFKLFKKHTNHSPTTFRKLQQ